jgi:SAM-dependent methyltransferase
MALNRLVDERVVAAWDRISTHYQDRYTIPVDEIHLGPMVPSPADLGIDLDVAGLQVLDFGCGGGQNAIACARAGARRVVAVDPSERQLDLAQKAASQAGAVVEFLNLGDDGLGRLGSGFDLVLSVYALQFIADAAAVMRLLAGLLRVGGRLVVSVDHPMRLSGEWRGDEFIVEGYFAEGWQSWSYDFPEAGVQVEMRRYRRPAQDWVNAVIAAPLALRGLYEPRPTGVADSFGRRSKYGIDDRRNVFSPERLAKVPGSLILVAERVHE